MRACRGCGAPSGPDTPVPDHCDQCPPWICDACGQFDSSAAPCPCWTPLDGMALADIKGLFAASGLSVDPNGDNQ